MVWGLIADARVETLVIIVVKIVGDTGLGVEVVQLSRTLLGHDLELGFEVVGSQVARDGVASLGGVKCIS